MERHVYDPNEPHGKMSLLNLRNVLRALHECDFIPMRPTAEFVIDDCEYGTNARAQSEWTAAVSGTVKTGSPVDDYDYGNYALEISDCGTDEKISRSRNIDLRAYTEIKLWAKKDLDGNIPTFIMTDSQPNTASWNLDNCLEKVSDFRSDILTLASPDSGSVDLSDVTSFGFSNLISDTQYHFDDVVARVGMAVAVESASAGEYYENIYRGGSRVTFAGGASPTITAPSSNPRIDLLYYTSDLAWVVGSEAASPTEPATPKKGIPLCLVYCKTTMTRVVNYEDKDAHTDEGYIYRDIRPIYNFSVSDHGQLDGLSDDDHIQYTLADGSRDFTGAQSMGNNKITDLQAGSASSDAVTYDQVVRDTGNQTIDGVKTFTSFPVLPATDPSGNEAVSESYLTDACNITADTSPAQTDKALTTSYDQVCQKTVTVHGGRCLIIAVACFEGTATTDKYDLKLRYDSTDMVEFSNLEMSTAGVSVSPTTVMVMWVETIAAGSYAFQLQARENSGDNVTCYGTKVPRQIMVLELPN